MTNTEPLHSRAYIHYDPERTDYSVTGEELEMLRREGQNLWKDVCLVSISLGIPTALNAGVAIASQTTFNLTLEIFVNSLVGVVGLSFGIVFGIAWGRSHTSLADLIEAIREKPKLAITPEAVDVGPIAAGNSDEQVP